MMRTAYNLRAADDDWGQAGTLLRDVMDDAERERLVSNVAGHLRNGVTSRSWSNLSVATRYRG
jgi:catalase